MKLRERIASMLRHLADRIDPRPYSHEEALRLLQINSAGFDGAWAIAVKLAERLNASSGTGRRPRDFGGIEKAISRMRYVRRTSPLGRDALLTFGIEALTQLRRREMTIIEFCETHLSDLRVRNLTELFYYHTKPSSVSALARLRIASALGLAELHDAAVNEYKRQAAVPSTNNKTNSGGPEHGRMV